MQLGTFFIPKPIANMSNRLAQVSGHVTNTYGRGLLAGEVAIITGEHGVVWHIVAL